MLKHKVRARAIYLVIFISFISSVILLFFISNNYYTQIETLHYQNLKKMVDACNSLIHYSLGENAEKKIELKDTGVDDSGIEASLHTEIWGGYSLAISKAQWHDINYSKAAIVGTYLFKEEKIGLYLADHGKYLSIAGNTELSGDCYLPALGIRSVYIDGKPYKGSKLIYGTEKTSKKELPKINSHFIDYIEKGLNGELGDSIGNIGDLYRKDNISQSFSQKSILYHSSSIIQLSNIKLSGKIIIQSDSLLLVSKSAKIQQIILIAPLIIIEKGFRGSLQAIASDSILIEEKVELEYPSMIAVYNPAGNNAFCYISKDATVSGGILCAAKMEDGKSAELSIQEDAVINGLVYCNGSVKLSGSILGSLYVNRFVLRTARGYYENHLFNAVVDPEAQYKKLIVPHILAESNKRGILQWVKY